jgi:hypothetical protein
MKNLCVFLVTCRWIFFLRCYIRSLYNFSKVADTTLQNSLGWGGGKEGPSHGLINYIDTKEKCRHLKKLTCKGTLRQVLIRVYRQEIVLVFSTQLCELLPLSSFLWFNSPPSLCELVYCVYTHKV